jgi:hypothetical protein
VDRALVPVVRVLLQHDAVLRHALDELVGARADRLGAELVALGLRRLGRDHHAGAVGQLRQQRREGRRQVQAHGGRVDHVHAGHRRQLAAAVRARDVLVALDVELDGGGVELLAVVEGHALAQLQVSALLSATIGSWWPAAARWQLLVDVEQLVAQAGEHHRPTKLRASDGSSTSGSSARPTRSVWAGAGEAAATSKAAQPQEAKRNGRHGQALQVV